MNLLLLNKCIKKMIKNMDFKICIFIKSNNKSNKKMNKPQKKLNLKTLKADPHIGLLHRGTKILKGLLNILTLIDIQQSNNGLLGLGLVAIIGVSYFGYHYFFPKIIGKVVKAVISEKADEILQPLVVDVPLNLVTLPYDLVKPSIGVLETINTNFYHSIWEISAIPFALVCFNIYQYSSITKSTSLMHRDKYKIPVFDLKSYMINLELKRIHSMLTQAPDFLKYCKHINDLRLKYWSVITNNTFRINILRLKEPDHILQCIDYVGDFYKIDNLNAYLRALNIIQYKKSPSLELVSASAYILSFLNQSI